MTIREKIQKSGQPLCEVKAGQPGMGLLVERDFHIIGNDDMVNQIKEDIQNDKKFVIPDRFIVNAIFQKYGVKNANGRIYPENVLKPEVERYIREKINGFGNCAIGALDHPSCQLADTQILTKYGWKLIQDVTTKDEVLTVTEDKKIEIQKILRKIDEPYSGDLIHIKGRHLDLEVTPQHKFPILDRFKKFKGFYTAEELYNGTVPDQSHCYLFKTGEWVGEDDEYFELEPISQSRLDGISSNKLKEKYSQSVQIPMKTWAKFLGIYLSEGWVTNVSTVGLAQRKKDVCEDIESLLDEMPFEYVSKFQNNGMYYYIFDLRLHDYLSKFGKCYDKYVPYEMKKQGKETLRIFYDWFVKGDGRKRGWHLNKTFSDDVFSTSKRLVMDLNEIQLKIGYSGAYHEENRHYDRYIEGRLIEGKNSQNMHFTYRSLWENILIGKLSIEKRHYDGRVYCIEVPNHTFYTMDKKGHCVWSGNSSSLSLHDVTHKILDLRWQGCTLLGEMELHLSPGYRKYGICSTSGDLAANLILDGILIGVSSRALGNVIDKYGTLIVDDDLELIGWDIVCENSTPGAHISTNPKDLEQFIESKEQDETKQQIQESKLDRLNKILLF